MPRAFLFLIALIFLGFGLWGLVAPAQMVGLAGLEATNPNGLVEIRAFYGGLEVGIGLFLLTCVARRARVDLGLRAVAWMLGCAALARGAGVLLDGREGWAMPGFVAAELVAAVVALVLIGRTPSSAR